MLTVVVGGWVLNAEERKPLPARTEVVQLNCGQTVSSRTAGPSLRSPCKHGSRGHRMTIKNVCEIWKRCWLSAKRKTSACKRTEVPFNLMRPNSFTRQQVLRCAHRASTARAASG